MRPESVINGNVNLFSDMRYGEKDLIHKLLNGETIKGGFAWSATRIGTFDFWTTCRCIVRDVY